MRPTPDAKSDARTRTRKKKKTPTKTPSPVTPTIVHTKRKEIEGEDGWIHIVDKPRSNQPDAKPKKQSLLGGDFEIRGVSYINRTLVEMKEDFEHWKRSWEERPICHDLKEKLKDVEKDRKIENVVVLGLGSLQSARREGRRSSATQLAALQTIVSGLERGAEMQITFQDPQYTKNDKEFLASLGYKVAKDPEAFAEVGEGSLVYAIHCYADVYKSVAGRPRPAVLIGTDVGNFARFDASEDTTARDLENMVDGCKVIEFPQLRHDFSDTKIYLRPTTKVETKVEPASVAMEESKEEPTPAVQEGSKTEPAPTTQEEHKIEPAPVVDGESKTEEDQTVPLSTATV
ncbi:hypothetical protein BKA65DRAFT_179782 [Rhexocercosporidium sp. MPI-PUGE-AT-0058]|nr:hypothetical protein BKA65DRAFT_179782 [Rhexocercosporidium sp. MPI-PUGE-AT-0058]